MTRYLHCLSLLARADRELSRACGQKARFSLFLEGLTLDSPARLAQCAWAIERSGGAADMADRVADAAGRDANLLAEKVHAAAGLLEALRDDSFSQPAFAGLEAHKKEDLWQSLVWGEDARRAFLTRAPAFATDAHLAALDCAVRHLAALSHARVLVAAFRELAGNPLGLRLPKPARVLVGDDFNRVRWSAVFRTLGTFTLENGVEVEAARTVAGNAVVGRRKGEVFIAEDAKGFPAGDYVQVGQDLWDRAFAEYGDDAPRQRALVASLERGQAALKNGSPVLARRHFDEVLSLDPDHLEATLGRVESLLIEGDPQAASAADQVCLLAPTEPRAHFLHALAVQAPADAAASLDAAARVLGARMSGPVFGDPIFWLPEDYWLRAEIARRAGQLDDARAGFEAVLATGEFTAQAWLGLGWMSLQAGEAPQAVEAFQTALSCEPLLADARRGLAQALIAAGEPARAIDTLFALGQWLFDQSWPAGALACFEQIVSLDPDHTAAITGAGFALDRLARAPEAADYFRRAAEIYLAQGRYTEAASHCDYALARNRQLVWALMCRAQCDLKQGEWAEALSNLNAVLRIEPDHTEALIAKAQVHVSNWEYNAAGECFDQVLEQHPTHPNALLGAGQLAVLNVDYTLAEMYFASVLRATPGHVGAQLGRAECLLAQGQFEAALTAFNAVIAAEPHNERAVHGLHEALRGVPPEVAGVAPLLQAADTLASRERWQEALALYSAAAAEAQDNPTVWAGIAHAQMKLNDHAAALRSFRKLLDLGEMTPHAKRGLGQTLIALQDFEWAQEVFESLPDDGPDRLEVLIGKAQALEGLGHWNEALAHYAGVLQADEQSLEGYLGKARMHLALTEHDAARRNFAYALAIQPGNAEALQGQRKLADLERS